MRNSQLTIRGTYLLVIYICLVGLTFISEVNNLTWLSQGAPYIALPSLLVFFWMNKSTDTRFEKHVFYGLVLFTISCFLSLIESVIGFYTLHFISLLWIVGFFNYTKALVSITSMSGSILFQNKWLSLLLLLIMIVGVSSVIPFSTIGMSSIQIPLICVVVISSIFLIFTINLYGQLNVLTTLLLVAAAVLLVSFSVLLALKFDHTVIIFDTSYVILYYIGQLVFIFAAVKAVHSFRVDDHSNISDALKNKLS